MIYEKDNVYYLKKGNEYEIATISIKYNRTRKKNVIVVTGSGEYINALDNHLLSIERKIHKERKLKYG